MTICLRIVMRVVLSPNSASEPLGGNKDDIRVWNSIVITSRLGSARLPASTIFRAIAHEIGHASGVRHTCDLILTNSCRRTTLAVLDLVVRIPALVRSAMVINATLQVHLLLLY